MWRGVCACVCDERPAAETAQFGQSPGISTSQTRGVDTTGVGQARCF